MTTAILHSSESHLSKQPHRSAPHWWRNTQTALGIELPISFDAGFVRLARRLGVGEVGSLGVAT